MGNREEYVQEIELRDLLFHILYRWRSVLLAAILGCALAGGFAAVKSGILTPAAQEQAGEGGKADPVKYAGAGFLGGAFLAAFLYGAGYTLSDKLRGERELRERYGYHLLGTLPKEEKKKILSGVDNWLKRLEGSAEKNHGRGSVLDYFH